MNRLIILRVHRDNERHQVSGDGVLWLQVPAGRERFYADPTFVSRYVDIDQDSLAALRDGRFVEHYVETGHYPFDPAMLDDQILASIMPDLQKLWQLHQDQITEHNPWAYFGTSWAGSNWSVRKVV